MIVRCQRATCSPNPVEYAETDTAMHPQFQCGAFLGTREIPQVHRLDAHRAAVRREDPGQGRAPVQRDLGPVQHEDKDRRLGAAEEAGQEQRHCTMVGGIDSRSFLCLPANSPFVVFYCRCFCRRPYNKSPSDQCRPYIMEILNGKNYYLSQYLQDQQSRLIEVGFG